MPARQAAPCLKCCEMIDVSAAAMVLQFRLRTVGLEDEVCSPSASVYICVQCSDLMAKGDEPPQRTRPLDHRVYLMVREMVTGDPSVTFLSWLALRKGIGLPAVTLIEPKILKAFNELRRVMALPSLIEGSEGDDRRLKEAS